MASIPTSGVSRKYPPLKVAYSPEQPALIYGQPKVVYISAKILMDPSALLLLRSAIDNGEVDVIRLYGPVQHGWRIEVNRQVEFEMQKFMDRSAQICQDQASFRIVPEGFPNNTSDDIKLIW